MPRTFHFVLVAAVISALGFLLSCEPRSTADPAAVQAQQELAAARDELAETRRAITAEKAHLASAKREVEFEECRARVSRIAAVAERLRASCLKEISTHHVCLVNVQRTKGDDSIAGCFLGFGLAALTGGAATPYALAGCGAGRAIGELTAKRCPAPTCASRLGRAVEDALVELREDSVPLCGGSLGVDVESGKVSIAAGVRVETVIEMSSAEAIGILPGDVIGMVNDRNTAVVADIGEALRGSQAGSTVRVRLVRKGQLVEVAGPLRALSDETLKLGIKGRPAEAGACTYNGLVAANVTDGRSAAQAGLRAGDQVIGVAIGAAPSAAVLVEADLRLALSPEPSGTSGRLQISRNGTPQTLVFALGERKGTTEL